MIFIPHSFLGLRFVDAAVLHMPFSGVFGLGSFKLADSNVTMLVEVWPWLDLRLDLDDAVVAKLWDLTDKRLEDGAGTHN